MAKTATITLSKSTAQVNERITAKVNISNGDASDVRVVEIKPLMRSTGGSNEAWECNGALGVVGLQMLNSTVPASGNRDFAFGVVGQAPSANHDGANTFDVTCDILLSDGTYIRPAVDTFTVEPVPQFVVA